MKKAKLVVLSLFLLALVLSAAAGVSEFWPSLFKLPSHALSFPLLPLPKPPCGAPRLRQGSNPQRCPQLPPAVRSSGSK